MSYKIKKEVIEIKEIEVSTLGEAVGFSVKTLRKKFGFSQEDLALKVGIARASISNIEMGRHNITLENLERLCKIFNVKSNEILPF